MSLLGSELCEVYGNNFAELMKNPEKKSRKKSKKPKKTKAYTNEDTMKDSLLNNFSGEMNSLVEGFANFEKKPEPRVEIVQPEQFEEDDEDSEASEDEEKVYKIKPEKKKKSTKSVKVPETNTKVQCEMDDMNDKINDLDVKLNLLLEKLNSREDKVDKSNEEKSELGNIYDLILFVIFGVFFLLVLESISKVVVKNATKLNNAPLVFNN